MLLNSCILVAIWFLTDADGGLLIPVFGIYNQLCICICIRIIICICIYICICICIWTSKAALVFDCQQWWSSHSPV